MNCHYSIAKRARLISQCLLWCWLLTVTAAHSATLDNISINGYLSFEYERHIDGDKINGDGDAVGDANGSFDMDLFDLVINIQATDKLRVATDLTWEHGSATEDGRGNVAMEYAFAEYTLSQHTKVRAGKMFTNFGIYNEIHTAKPATLSVKEPQSTNKNDKLGSDIRFYPRWLNGLAVIGHYQLPTSSWDYVLQLSNGESEDANPYEEDDNTHKAFNGRLRYRPTDTLQVGFSFYRDSMQDTSATIEIGSYGLQLEWESQGDQEIGVEFEFVSGNEDHSNGANIQRHAYTFMVFKPVTDTITPYVRVEYLEPNQDITDDEASVLVLGSNILIDEGMFLKLELDYFSGEDNNGDLSGASYSEVKMSLSVGF